MAAIWKSDGSSWELLSTDGFTDEATLHSLIEEAPQLLPLAGNPELVIAGREVQLGTNTADLIAVETTGRVVILEIKLARNSESRRAVVAQILTYAAYLDGQTREAFETDIVGAHLVRRGFTTLAAAVEAQDQVGTFSRDDFDNELATSLIEGRFRLVLVLDDAPDELVRLVGYLSKVTQNLVIDLVTISAYNVGGSRIIVPQRVDPERYEGRATTRPSLTSQTTTSSGITDFVAALESYPDSLRDSLGRCVEWALSLQDAGLARLVTTIGTTRNVLRPCLPGRDSGLISVSSDSGLRLWRSAFERYAPESLQRLEDTLKPTPLKQGTTIRDPSPVVLGAIADAYREAVELARLPADRR